ncbi:unnamed protein product [Prunus armeniaca]
MPKMEHFFDQQWKDQGMYHLIKLFDRPLVMDRLLLAAALCFWSSTTNTMNLRFGMMTPTVLDMAALFGLSPLAVEVNATLVTPEAEGSFKAAWPTVAKLAGSKPMMIPSVPWARSSMPCSCCTGYASSYSAPRRTKSPWSSPIWPTISRKVEG